jgi:pyruvate formate lyase activating enzyme
MGKPCEVCGDISKPVSKALGVCLDCIKGRWSDAEPFVEIAHAKARARHGLPGNPPRTEGGVSCSLCSNQCVIGDGERGYCGLRSNEGGLRSLADRGMGLLHSYIDSHVTNCCSAWFCPAGTGSGYPEYARRDGPERGYSNLAVFFYGCNFDCLFCQNSSHKNFGGMDPQPAGVIARRVEEDPRISCVCYFGGSPEPQLPYAIQASRLALEARRSGPLRICFEWNGCGDPALVRRAAELSLESGGNVKFDLKCSTPELSLALSGVPNERAFRNFEMIAEEHYPERVGMPVLTASTLLVPGYVDAWEVGAIAEFIAGLDPSIPYSLLAFHPSYQMADLPYTPLRQAVECYRAARRHLERVHVGNLHILGLSSMSRFVSIAGEP